VLNVVNDRRHVPFRNGNDPVADLLRIETVVIPDDADDRNIDIGKYVRWRVKDCDDPQDQDQDRHYHKGIWPP